MPLENREGLSILQRFTMRGRKSETPTVQNISTEERVRTIQEERKKKSEQMEQEGKTLQEMITSFDNDYSALEDLYREKTGVDLITHPYEASEHPIPISKSCSIVIPAYNSGKQLEVTLHAIQASSFNAKYPQQLEVIIVDDGSPSVNVAQQVKNMGFHDLSIKVLRQTNGRENKARYSGVLAASGDVVIFTSQDIVYSPIMIEEYMKRHQILEDVVCFGFQNEIETSDERLKPENIAKGSLEQIPMAFRNDSRIGEDGMIDSRWLKEYGNNRPIVPIKTKAQWDWHLGSIAWGQSVSAPRETLLKTICSADDRYKGYGLDDEQLVNDLTAEGLYVIPNTGGLTYHQRHSTRRDEKALKINRDVFEDNLHAPPRRQDPNNPKRTDAQIEFDGRNTRVEAREPVGIPRADAYGRAKTLYQIGLYDKSLELFEQQDDHDFWFIADRAGALVAVGGKKNVTQAIKDLEMLRDINPGETWIHSNLAIAYGRIGEYEKCRQSYEEAYALNPQNWQAGIIAPFNEDPHVRAEKLKEEGTKKYLDRGKPREALRCLEAALALIGEEQMPWAVFNKGKALAQIGLFDDAIEQLQISRRLMPQETWVDSQIGLMYEQQGNVKEAKKYFTSALSKSKENWEAEQGLVRLKS